MTNKRGRGQPKNAPPQQRPGQPAGMPVPQGGRGRIRFPPLGPAHQPPGLPPPGHPEDHRTCPIPPSVSIPPGFSQIGAPPGFSQTLPSPQGQGPPPQMGQGEPHPPPGRTGSGQGPPPGRTGSGQGPPPGRMGSGQGPPPGRVDLGQGLPPGRMGSGQGEPHPPPGRTGSGQGEPHPPPGRTGSGQGPPPGRTGSGQGPPPGRAGSGQGPPPGRAGSGQASASPGPAGDLPVARGKIPLALRPGGGTHGAKIGLVVNFFRLNSICKRVYHYDIDMKLLGKKGEEKDIRNKRFKRLLFEAFRQSCDIVRGYNPVYDGNKSMLTPRPLPIKASGFSHTFEYEEDGRSQTFSVHVKPVKNGNNAIYLDQIERGYNHYDAMMAIEIIFRYRPAAEFVPVGRSLFPKPGSPYKLAGGLEMWNGYYLNVQIGQAGPFVNLDRAATAFYPEGPLMDFVLNMQNTHDMSRISLVDVNRKISHLKVMVSVNNGYKRPYTLDRLVPQTARQKTFTTDNGETISVEQYFRNKYNYRLRYPNYPLVQMTSSRGNSPFLPLEVCQIKSCQHFRFKLNELQTSDMVKINAVEPIKRFEEILRKMKDFNHVLQPLKKDYEIDVELTPYKLIGRILNPPRIRFRDGQINTRDGTWDLRGVKFFEPCNIKCWLLISFAYERFLDYEKLDKFASLLVQQARTLGMAMAPVGNIEIASHINVERAKCQDFHNLFNTIKQNYPSLDLAVIVLAKKGNKEQHAWIKRACDIKLCIPTQCIKEENVARAKPQLIVNLLQKINTKMGGINSVALPQTSFRIFGKPCMVMGADVNHPAPGDIVTPSIAAVVGSIDPHPFRYYPTVRLQNKNFKFQARLEIIQDLKDMTKELLKAYYSNNKKTKPQSLLFFRDGVSEGQFQEVLREELPQIKNACTSLEANYNPTITFVVVQKRHHARFMPENPRDGVGKCKNIPPGTTVDTDITHPHNFDYYQCSHFGIQGTSRPTKYVVLYDENKFGADEMQELTNWLCHSFSRCARSISLVTPAQYAHLVAFRAKEHLAALRTNTSWTEQDLEGSTPISREMKEAIAVDTKISKSMYFV